MAINRKTGGMSTYEFPKELVWRSIAGDKHEIDPLDEEKYNNTTPGPNTVYTRSLEFKVNEVFAFEMKTARYTTRWRVVLTELGPCRTRVSIQVSTDYMGAKNMLLHSIGGGMGYEVRSFLKSIHKKLDEDMK